MLPMLARASLCCRLRRQHARLLWLLSGGLHGLRAVSCMIVAVCCAARLLRWMQQRCWRGVRHWPSSAWGACCCMVRFAASCMPWCGMIAVSRMLCCNLNELLTADFLLTQACRMTADSLQLSCANLLTAEPRAYSPVTSVIKLVRCLTGHKAAHSARVGSNSCSVQSGVKICNSGRSKLHSSCIRPSSNDYGVSEQFSDAVMPKLQRVTPCNNARYTLLLLDLLEELAECQHTTLPVASVSDILSWHCRSAEAERRRNEVRSWKSLPGNPSVHSVRPD